MMCRLGKCPLPVDFWINPFYITFVTETPMIQAELNDAISIAFYNLANSNEMLYDYWLTELYDEEGDIISEQWNDRNLKLMEDDVMNQVLAVDNS